MKKLMTKKIYDEIVKVTKASLEIRHSLEKAFESPNSTHYNPNQRAQNELETTEKAYFDALKSSSDQRDRLRMAYDNNQSQEWKDKLEATMAKMDYSLDRLEAEIVAWKEVHQSRPDLELEFHNTAKELADVWAARKKNTSSDARNQAPAEKAKLDKIEQEELDKKLAYRTSII